MLNYNVRFTERPPETAVTSLPDGRYDIWLRKGIGSETRTDEAGASRVEYYAGEEAYARLDAVPGNLRADFDRAFELAAAWGPDASAEPSEAAGPNVWTLIEALSANGEKLAANVDYIAMMADIELPDYGEV